MKSISTRQPWSYLISISICPIGSRSWKSNYRGELLIHAGQSFDHDGARWVINHYPHLTKHVRESKNLTGGFCGIVNMTDCIKDYNHKWFVNQYGRYAHIYTNPQQIHFIPYKGFVNIFTVPDKIKSRIVKI